MPLPATARNVPWPPSGMSEALAAIAEWAAWYGGVPDELSRVYGGVTTYRSKAPRWMFWAREHETSVSQRVHNLHVPLAADIAATSAALLFSEAPTVQIPEAHAERPATEAVDAEKRLLEILEAGDVESRLIEAAETAAALGGVYLKPDWDTELVDVPLLTVVQPDQVIGEFRFNILTAATLWRTVGTEGQNVVWRHLERHEVDPDGRGVILHGLYRGSQEKLGERRDLTAHSATAGLAEVVLLPFDGLGIRYVPNLRPNRRLRGSPLGQSDYAGAEGMLSALDQTWSSWMRDIRLGKARILVPDAYLENQDGELRFDLDQEVFVPLTMEPGSDQSITPQQFELRVDEHERTMLALVEQIVSHAGYSPQTFGLDIQGRAESGTALKLRERKSLMTQQRKRRHWQSGLADLLFRLQAIDREVFGSRITPMRPAVSLADSLTPDESELATTVELISRAGAASTETLVRTLHPGWTEEQVSAETVRIREERGLMLPSLEQMGDVA